MQITKGLYFMQYISVVITWSKTIIIIIIIFLCFFFFFFFFFKNLWSHFILWSNSRY